jgi:toxin ParE1/3/4
VRAWVLSLLKTPKAEDDLLEIWQHTYDTWGEDRADRYLEALDSDMQQLIRTPMIGKSRSSLREGYRSLYVGRHVVYYRLHAEAVEIVRVLHDRMDPTLHLGVA